MAATSETFKRSTMTGLSDIRYPEFSKPIITLVGGFGSGKTEVSVNLAKYMTSLNKGKVAIVDLDLVNPYFRSREAIKELEALGIEVVAPKGGQFYADLPILLPEIKGMIEKPDRMLILDVGGDEQGSKALGSLSDDFPPEKFELLMVLNIRRPQTSDIDGCIKTMERIEKSARLRFTGLISNSHMIDETDEAVVREGYELTRKLARKTGLKLAFVSAKENIIAKMDVSAFKCPFLPLTRSMLKPWERKQDPA